jgi:hypothetical protein
MKLEFLSYILKENICAWSVSFYRLTYSALLHGDVCPHENDMAINLITRTMHSLLRKFDI